jgi:hypothetical protein
VSDNVRLYAGTHEGLYILRPSGTGWSEVSRHFEDGIIDSMAGGIQRPENVYVGIAHNGVYRTEDAGQHWTVALEGDVRSLAVDPLDESVVYAGMEPTQLFRSEDRGATWHEVVGLMQMPQEIQDNWWSPVSGVGHVRNIFIQPDDSNTIYLALEHGGIVRSFDRGETWEDVSQGIDYLDIHLVFGHPIDANRYYVSSARGFFKSDDPAKGWVRAENGFTRDYYHDFIFLPPRAKDQNPTMLIATADHSPGYWDRENGVRSARAAIFRSEDNAGSWQRVVEGLPDEIAAMISTLAPHPSDPNSAYAGMGEVSRGHAHGEAGHGWIAVTRDRGESWQDLGVDLPADRVVWAAPE